ncbi:hypothetical protein APHAL10511_003052 [Amanita phalloides]|nr:hypothetical protein APHAL10511_003052 [Amanita phalloides]
MAKDVAPPPHFPWDQLKAGSMRSICRDLGFKQTSTREVMTQFFQTVSKVGLHRALDSASALPPARTSQKRTRATTNQDVSTTPSATTRRGVTSTGRRSRAHVPRGRAGQKQQQQQHHHHHQQQEAEAADDEEEQEVEQEVDDEEGEEDEESEERSRPSKRSRTSTRVVSNYNTRFRSERRGIMSDPGHYERGGGRRRRGVLMLPGGEPVSLSAIVGRPGRATRARALSGRRRARTGARARGRVRIEEPAVSETSAEEGDEGGEEVTVLAASVGRARGRFKRAINVRKTTVRVNGLSGSDEEVVEVGDEKVVQVRKRARERKLPRPMTARPVSARSRAGKKPAANGAGGSKAGQRMVIDGIDVPPVSKAVSVAMKKREMALGDEDADGEEEEEHPGKVEKEVEEVEVSEEGVVVGHGPVEVEVEVEEEGRVPNEDQDQMPIDEGEPQEGGEDEYEDDEDEYEPIPEDTSSPGNSNKENEAPEGEQDQTVEMDTIGAAAATTDMEIEDEMTTQFAAAATAAAALFGVSGLVVASGLGGPSTNGDESGVAEGNDNTAAGDLNSFLM